jgi:hypothetical protein
MSLHRAMLFALAFIFTAGMTSVASACCGWGVQAPVAYAPAGCGGCATPSAAVVYAQPVAPAVTAWGAGWGGGCGCHRGLFYAATPAVEITPIAPAPIYVVNQGPDYTGPGIMVPYHTWSAPVRVTPGAYPYRPGYGYRYGYRYRYWHRGYAFHRPYFAPRFHVVYHARFYGHPVYHGSVWRRAVHRYYR